MEDVCFDLTLDEKVSTCRSYLKTRVCSFSGVL
jgi:hypothetical protein